jgi:hypothetical protein
MMKDSILLLLTALLCSLAAWAFWHFLGSDAITVFSTLMLICVVGDNFRLRRKLRALQRGE